jgi:hypothetical protein
LSFIDGQDEAATGQPFSGENLIQFVVHGNNLHASGIDSEIVQQVLEQLA